MFVTIDNGFGLTIEGVETVWSDKCVWKFTTKVLVERKVKVIVGGME